MKSLYLILFLSILPTFSIGQVDVLPFKKNGKWGFVQDTGSIIIPPIYDAIENHSIGIDRNFIKYYIVQQDNRFGFVTSKGKIVLEPKYNQNIRVIKVYPLMLKIEHEGKTIIVNDEGKKIMDDDYSAIKTSSFDYLFVEKDKKWGVFQKGKGLIIPTQYDDFTAAESYYKSDIKGYFIFTEDNKKGLIDSLENVIMPAQFSRISIMGDIIVTSDTDSSMLSLYDFDGENLGISCYDIGYLNKDILRIKTNETYARAWQINTRTWITPDSLYHHLEMGGFRTPYILSSINYKGYGVLTLTGEVLLTPKYNNLSLFNANRNIYRYQLDGLDQYGLVKEGDEILHDTIFSSIRDMTDSLSIAYQYEKKGVLNQKGELIVPAEYDMINIDGRTINAYLDHQLTRFTVAADGSVTKGNQLKNVFTLKAGYSNKRTYTTNSRFRRNRIRIPWVVYTQNPTRNNLKIFKEKKLKGLVDINTGEIVVPANYQSIIRINGTELCILYKRKKQPEIILDNIYGTEVSNEQFIFSETKRQFIHSHILGVNVYDFGQSNYASYLQADGQYGLISKEGELKRNKENQVFLATYIGAFPEYEQGAKVYIGGYLKSTEWMGNHPNFVGSMADVVSPFKIKYKNNLTTTRLRAVEGLWSYLDANGEMITPPCFITTRNFQDSVAVCQLPSGFGLINIHMDSILPFHFTEIKNFDSREKLLEVAKKNTKPVYLSNHGAMITALEDFSSIGAFKNGFALVQKGELYGFINEKFEETIPCQWKYARPFSEGMAAIFHKKQWHFIDTSGQVVLSLNKNIRNVGKFQSGLVWFQVGSFFGYASKTDSMAIFPKFKEALDFKGNVAVVKGKTGFGVINKDGSYIIKPTFSNIKQFNNSGIAPYKSTDSRLYGLLANNGKILTDTKYDFIGRFENGYAKVKAGYLYGLIDSLGNEILPVVFEELGFLKNGLVKVRPRYGNWQYRDLRNKIRIKGPFLEAYDFQSGYAMVVQKSGVDPSYSIINKQGEFLYRSTPQERIIHFSENIRGVRRKETNKLTKDVTIDYYLIDTTNRVLGGYFQKVEPFKDGIALVKTQRGWGAIDKYGMYVVEPKYRKIVRQKNNLFKAITTSHKGIYKQNGTPVLEPIYDVLDHTARHIRLEKDGETGYFRINKGWILEIE